MSTTDVTNPGLVNVAGQAFDGLPSNAQASNGVRVPANASVNNVSGAITAEKPLSVDQPVTVTPPMTSQRNVDGDDESSVLPLSVNQPVTVQVPGRALDTIQGGSAGAVSLNVITTTQNTVVNQIYGVGTPANVYV